MIMARATIDIRFIVLLLKGMPEKNVGVAAQFCGWRKDATLVQHRILGNTTLIDKRLSVKTANYQMVTSMDVYARWRWI
jgi:hypothetical protein